MKQAAAGMLCLVMLIGYSSVSLAEVPSPEAPPIAPAQELDKDVGQSSSEIQERGVFRLPPGGLRPLSIMPVPLPGEFIIETFGGYYLTAVNGGGRTTDVMHTDARRIGTWEKFRLSGTGSGQFAIQTASGNYVTAMNGGGLAMEAVHTDAVNIAAWEQFRMVPDQYGWRHALQTVNGHYLTAVGTGGKSADAIHADAQQTGNWEQFYIWKCGDLGTSQQYTLSAQSEPNGFVFAYGGGGRVNTRDGNFIFGTLGVLSNYKNRPRPFDNDWQRFRLLRQPDGSYALQTSNGINYVTAIKGGDRRRAGRPGTLSSPIGHRCRPGSDSGSWSKRAAPTSFRRRADITSGRIARKRASANLQPTSLISTRQRNSGLAWSFENTSS